MPPAHRPSLHFGAKKINMVACRLGALDQAMGKAGRVILFLATAILPLPGIAGAAGSQFAPIQLAATRQVQPQVHLFRGFANVFSLGLDTMADKIEAAGVAASVHGHLAWAAVAAEIVAKYKLDRRNRPIVLIGHSLGAGAVVRIAERLNQEKISVDLLVMIGLPGKETVPPNVIRALNIQPDRANASVAPRDGFRGDLDNIDMNKQPELLRAGRSNHFTMESNTQLHKRIVDEVLRAVRSKHAAS